MEEDPPVASSKTKSDAKRKIKSGFQNFSAKIETLENKYEEIRRRIRKKSRSNSPKSSESKGSVDSSSLKEESGAEKKSKEAKDSPKEGNVPAVKQNLMSFISRPGKMELYYFTPSPPCRAVMLFMHALSLDPIMKEVDVSKGYHLRPEYAKLNPQKTIPVIVDEGFVLSESRAILGYLAEQYGGQNTTYYPNDPKARGVINQRLMFDIGTLYQRFLDAYMGMLLSDEPVGLDQEKLMKLREAFEFLEIFMGDSEWMAGDEITIADYSLVVTVSTIEACGFDIKQYRRVSDWLERCKTNMVNYEEANQRGADIFGRLVQEKLKMIES